MTKSSSITAPAASRAIKALAAVVLFGSGLMLAGCNTTAGAGQDVSAVGNAVTNGAQKAKTGL